MMTPLISILEPACPAAHCNFRWRKGFLRAEEIFSFPLDIQQSGHELIAWHFVLSELASTTNKRMKLISALLLLMVSATVPLAAVGQECTASTTCVSCVETPTCTWVTDTNQCLSNCPKWPGIDCITDGDAMSCPMAPPIDILPETSAPTDLAESPTDAPEVATAAPTAGTVVSGMPTMFDPQIHQRCPAGHVAQRDTLEDGEICLFCIPEGMCFRCFCFRLSIRLFT